MSDVATYAATRLKEIKADLQPWQDPLKWRREFAMADSPELQHEVLGLARQLGADSFLAILPQALACDDLLVRLDAARSIALLSEDRRAEGVTIGVEALDEDIRDEVLQLLPQAPVSLQPELFRRALASSHADVLQRATEMISAAPSPELFGVLIGSLSESQTALPPAIDNTIAQLVGERFTNAGEAKRWWTLNRGQFDDMLLRSEDPIAR